MPMSCFSFFLTFTLLSSLSLSSVSASNHLVSADNNTIVPSLPIAKLLICDSSLETECSAPSLSLDQAANYAAQRRKFNLFAAHLFFVPTTNPSQVQKLKNLPTTTSLLYGIYSLLTLYLFFLVSFLFLQNYFVCIFFLSTSSISLTWHSVKCPTCNDFLDDFGKSSLSVNKIQLQETCSPANDALDVPNVAGYASEPYV